MILQEEQNNSVGTKIIEIKRYKFFLEMLKNYNYKNFIPMATNLEKAEEIYNNIPGYFEKVKNMDLCALNSM